MSVWLVSEVSESKQTLCWICGDNATTGEHRVKRSDLQAVFGKPTNEKPYYFHTEKTSNYKVRSLKADILKSPSKLCARCNNERTQPYDYAWQNLSQYFRVRQPPVTSGSYLRANRVWQTNARGQMRNVHLFFLKLFGCLICEGNIPIEIMGFSNSILKGRPNPDVYLCFGLGDEKVCGWSSALVMQDKLNGECVACGWEYYAGFVVVRVFYAIEGLALEGLKTAWHPKSGTTRIRVSDMR